MRASSSATTTRRGRVVVEGVVTVADGSQPLILDLAASVMEFEYRYARRDDGTVDMEVSKTSARKGVRVRVPLPAQTVVSRPDDGACMTSLPDGSPSTCSNSALRGAMSVASSTSATTA